MEFFLYIKRVVSVMLLPPMGLFVVALLLMVWRSVSVRASSHHLNSRPVGRARQLLAMLLILLGLVLCTHEMSRRMIGWVEAQAGTPLNAARALEWSREANGPKAVVILAGGLSYDEREPDDPWTPSWRTLQRVIYGARLARQVKLPVLVTGGIPANGTRSEGRVMADMMERDLQMKPQWVEEGSRDTRDNARMSASMLAASGVRSVFLVTHAVHMARSRLVFEQAGLVVIPAPMGYMSALGSTAPQSWVPNPDAAAKTWYAFHELVGLLWYRVSA